MNNLYEVIEVLFKNRRRIGGGFAGYILAHTYIKYGLNASLILALFTIIGYNYSDILKKIKKVIRERMNEEY
jgi:hypothetical protein